jgi:hypothetical protein
MTAQLSGPGEREIPATGGQGEINALVRRYNEGSITDAERLRLAALSFTADERLEQVRLVRDRHPDVYHHISYNERLALEKTYEPQRQAAIDAGRSVSEQGPDVVEWIDASIKAFRETATTPCEFERLEQRYRAAIYEAVAGEDVDLQAAARLYRRWLRDNEARNRFLSKRANAMRVFGHSGVPAEVPIPGWGDVIDAAMGTLPAASRH